MKKILQFKCPNGFQIAFLFSHINKIYIFNEVVKWQLSILVLISRIKNKKDILTKNFNK